MFYKYLSQKNGTLSRLACFGSVARLVHKIVRGRKTVRIPFSVSHNIFCPFLFRMLLRQIRLNGTFYNQHLQVINVFSSQLPKIHCNI